MLPGVLHRMDDHEIAYKQRIKENYHGTAGSPARVENYHAQRHSTTITRTYIVAEKYPISQRQHILCLWIHLNMLLGIFTTTRQPQLSSRGLVAGGRRELRVARFSGSLCALNIRWYMMKVGLDAESST